LIARYGCNIVAFDPTPRSAAWITSQTLPTQFHFQELGLGAQDSTMEFWPPPKEDWVSYSASPHENFSGGAVTRPVRRLPTMMGDFGHRPLDVFKMDIEGFEYDVIDDVLASGIRPVQWLIEFHHEIYGIEPQSTLGAVAKLQQHG
jgi:FkbM family methyltransferase